MLKGARGLYTNHAVSSKLFSVQKIIAVVAAASAAYAGSPAIGIITASGHFTVAGSRIWGNSTIFDGAVVETGSASSELALRNGVKLQLAAGSRARVWEDHATLDRGVGQVAGNSPYEVTAGGLRIRADGEGARLRVGLRDRFEVTALTGSARIADTAGLLLAAIPAGRTMTLSMQAAGQAASTGALTRTGCLLYKDGHFILQDENTQEVVELLGRDLSQNTGNRVTAAGTAAAVKPSVSLATTVLNVASVTVRSQGGCLSAAAALDARTEVPVGGGQVQPSGVKVPKVGGGMSTGAKIAIVGAVAGGGAGAALALAGKKSSTSP